MSNVKVFLIRSTKQLEENNRINKSFNRNQFQFQMDSSTEYTEEYSYDSEVSDGQEDWSELCAFVKYNEKMKRDGPALIYIADNYIFTSYKDGKCEKGYTLHGRNGLSEIRYENNEITNVKVVEVNSGVLRDPTNTFEFNGYIAGESPMGLGVCKDLATDEVVYKGIMIGWERNIEGISVKDNKKIYRGSWCANKRCGFGIEYDEKEMILREGYWFNDEFIKSGLFLASPLNSSMSKWKVNNSVCSEVLYLSGFQALEDVTFDSKSFETVGTVNISGLRKLRSIEFESKSFSMFGYSNPKRRFSVSDCPSLKTIIIEKYSFTDYTQFELSQLDSLEVIKIGSLDSDSFNFYEASFCIQSNFFNYFASRSPESSCYSLRKQRVYLFQAYCVQKCCI